MTSPVRAPRPTPRRTPRQTSAEERRAQMRVVSPPPGRRGGRPSGRELRRRRTGAVLVVAMAIVFGALLASAMFHGLLASGQANLDRLDGELRQERTSLAQEQLELADLRSPQRISHAATALGMVPADTQHWVSAATGDETVVTRDDAETTDTQTDETPSSTSSNTSELAGGTATTANGTGTEAP